MDEDGARTTRDQRKRADLLAGLRLESRLREANPPTPARAEEERRRRRERIAGILRDAEAGAPEASFVDTETAELLRAELARLEGAVAPSHTGPTAPLVAIGRSNTILYCLYWLPTVGFYRDDLGLPVVAESEWYVEFRITTASSLSIADSTRTTIEDVDGQGITLSWRVADLTAARKRLVDNGLEPSKIRRVGGAAAALYLFDPEGHRIEIWSEAA